MVDGTFVVCWIVVWIVFGWIEEDGARAWARTALIAVGLCWLIVRSGLISI